MEHMQEQEQRIPLTQDRNQQQTDKLAGENRAGTTAEEIAVSFRNHLTHSVGRPLESSSLIDQYRTIPIETRDPYTLLPKIQTYVAEVTNQVRRALANAESGDNPISLYYPNARLVVDPKK